MKKTVLYFGGGILVISIIAAIAGKITFEQVGYLNSIAAAVLFGLYQKVTKDMVEDEHVTTLLELEYLNNEHTKLISESAFLQDTVNTLHSKLEASTAILPELKKVVESTTTKEKPKRVRNKQTK